MVQPCRFELLLWQLFGLKLGSGGTAPTLSGDIEYLRVFGLPCRLRLSFVQDFGDTRVYPSSYSSMIRRVWAGVIRLDMVR